MSVSQISKVIIIVCHGGVLGVLTHAGAVGEELLSLLLAVEVQLAVADVEDGALLLLPVGALGILLVCREVQNHLVLGGADLGEVDRRGRTEGHDAELAHRGRA